ncbi:hypothetical protein [Actinoplanes sp. GCM10030250]|uniref:hypothetical protein n=1 Tax=Actinoplanes sp. GCM10030250 TaxID=3273376 RepID=UPI0036191D38
MRRTVLAVALGALAASTLFAAPASAKPTCDDPIPPPGCEEPGEPGDPPPPPGADQQPQGWLDAYHYESGRLRVTGWAADPDGGPVSIMVSVDGAPAGPFAAASRYAARNADVGFDITVPAPSNAGSHRVCVTALNVPGGTGYAPSSTLSCPSYQVDPAVPGNLTVTAGTSGFDNAYVDVAWSDNSSGESHYALNLSWMALVMGRDGKWVRVTEARAVQAAGLPGTGWTGTRVTGLPSNTYIMVTLATVEAGRYSATVTGGVRTP